MSERHRWERLIGIMEQERDLLDEFARSMGSLRSSLHEKQWTNLEESLKHLDSLADKIEVVEKKREAFSQRVCETRESFEKKLIALPPETRGHFRSVRNEIKTRLTTIRSRTSGIAGYAESQARLGKEILEELIPSTRGRIYDNRGRTASAGRDPLVVSRHL